MEVLKRVELRCEATGQPEPSTTWFKDNEMLVEGEGEEDNVNLMMNSSMLIIRSMLLADKGNYTCMKANRGGAVVGYVQLSIVEGKKVITTANIVKNTDKKLFVYKTIKTRSTKHYLIQTQK